MFTRTSMSPSSQQHAIVTIARTHLFFPRQSEPCTWDSVNAQVPLQETMVMMFRCPFEVCVFHPLPVAALTGFREICCCIKSTVVLPLARVTHVAVGSLLPSTIVPVSTSCPLALHSLLILRLRSLPASFHRSSACHFIRRALRFLFLFLPFGLPSPTVAPSHTLCDAAVPSIAPIGRRFCHTEVTTFSSVFACVQILLLLLQLDSCRQKTAHTGITPQEQSTGKYNTSTVEFSTVCTVSCVCARLFFSSVSSHLHNEFSHVRLMRASLSHLPNLSFFPRSFNIFEM